MPSSDRATDASLAVVLARPPLAALVALILRHCSLDTVAVTTAERAHAGLADDARLLLVELAHPRATASLLEAASSVPTVALVELERGGSSFAAFVAGADQVVRVPFTPDELAVRAGALLRRLGREVAFRRDHEAGGLGLSLDEHVLVGGQQRGLDPMANSALYLLIANLGRHVTRDDIRALVWGIGSDASDARVDRAMRSVMRRLGREASVHVAFDAEGVTMTVHPQ